MEHKFTTFTSYPSASAAAAAAVAWHRAWPPQWGGKKGGVMLVMAATWPPAALTYLKVIWELAGQPQWPPAAAAGGPESSMGPN
jgi:hypothetical protein